VKQGAAKNPTVVLSLAQLLAEQPAEPPHGWIGRSAARRAPGPWRAGFSTLRLRLVRALIDEHGVELARLRAWIA